MISIKSEREISLLKEAGHIVYLTHKYLKPFIKAGITTKELDKLAYDFITSKGATPSFKGYNGYPATICASINQEVVHGIPGNRKLKNGDIISIDIGACFKGYHGDSAWTYAVGEVEENKKYLMEHTEKSLYFGLEVIKPGARVGDIGNAIESYATKHKLGVIKELVGHGVGKNIHEEPDVPNYGIKGTGPILKEGMVIAVEPMLTSKSPEIVLLDDDWTIETEDYSDAAHYEHTVVVTKNGYKILTGGKNGEE
ncbi:MAG: type I methionyl aminopeptidase [Bacilli bacterium]|nr:type I methionyl aminopeptidase [Bacilli bacterium]